MSEIVPSDIPQALRLFISEHVSSRLALGLFVWAAILLSLVAPRLFHKSAKAKEYLETKEQPLFPSIERYNVSGENVETPLTDSCPQPCSTGLTTRLLPFKNERGEIEWVFTEDAQPGHELDVFKANPGMFRPKVQESKVKPNSVDTLSPVTSNSSAADSLTGKRPEEFTSPLINTPSSTVSDDKEDSPDGENESVEEEDAGDDAGEEGDANSTSAEFPHKCPKCHVGFRMRGYLTRHMKKHMSQKAYHCPFHGVSTIVDSHDRAHKCHLTGDFSRRDTYKTHLKTRHFRFPEGTPTKSRNLSPGNCALCGEWFHNAEIWTELHIEGGECRFLPEGFQGKSRIKNKMRKQEAKRMREEKREGKRDEKRIRLKGRMIEYMSPGMGTPPVDLTPLVSSVSQYEYEDSPTQSSCSSLGPQRFVPLQRPLYVNSPMSEQNLEVVLPPVINDYDDEFCLDTEQMFYPVAPFLDVLAPNAGFPVLAYLVPDFGDHDSVARAAFGSYEPSAAH